MLDTLLHAAQAGTVSDALLDETDAALRNAEVDYLMEEVPKAIQQSLDGMERVGHIVRAMREFSHPGVDQKESVDLNRAIQSTLTVCRSGWKYVATVVTDLAPDLPTVPCLVGEVNQVILNLVLNAAHAIAGMPGEGSQLKGTITLRTHKTAIGSKFASKIPVPASRSTSATESSTPSSPPRTWAKARDWDFRFPMPRSSTSTAARSTSRRKKAKARPSSFACRLPRACR